MTTIAELKRQQAELQRRILELILDFEAQTDWRVQSINFDPLASKITTVLKKPLH